jgi:hypothetical protein
MATTRFWERCSPDSTRKLAEWTVDRVDTEKVDCPVNPGHQRDGKRVTDLSVSLPSGTVDDFAVNPGEHCTSVERSFMVIAYHPAPRV